MQGTAYLVKTPVPGLINLSRFVWCARKNPPIVYFRSTHRRFYFSAQLNPDKGRFCCTIAEMATKRFIASRSRKIWNSWRSRPSISLLYKYWEKALWCLKIQPPFFSWSSSKLSVETFPRELSSPSNSNSVELFIGITSQIGIKINSLLKNQNDKGRQ